MGYCVRCSKMGWKDLGGQVGLMICMSINEIHSVMNANLVMTEPNLYA
jgi:hypothetical protein